MTSFSRYGRCFAACALLLACGDSTGTSATSGISVGPGSTTEATTAPTTTAAVTESASESASSSASASGTGTGTASATTSAATTEATSSTDAPDTTGVGSSSGSTTGNNGCPDPGGVIDFSYIWIANSPEGTVSKIDTTTLEEVGRYRVRPQGGGLPSRTSVNLRGDVVIGSREGGVTKIYARTDDCKESNGTPGLQTSTGKADVLQWGVEECVAWYTDYNFLSERAVAWTTGELNMQTCQFENPKVWVGATSDAVTLRIFRLLGDTGAMDGMVDIPGTAGYMERSPYGAAVDAAGDVWMVNAYCGGTLMVVHDDFSYELLTVPAEICPYGIAVDSKGYVWIGGYQTYSGRYDPMMQKWDLVQAQGLGIQEDAQGKLWLGAFGQNAVIEIDGDTLQVLSTTAVPTTGQSKGISIDFFGYVWVVSDAGTTAVRLDPMTKQFKTYTGLTDPYSYSDMTGWGLKNASIPQ